MQIGCPMMTKPPSECVAVGSGLDPAFMSHLPSIPHQIGGWHMTLAVLKVCQRRGSPLASPSPSPPPTQAQGRQQDHAI